MGVRLMWVFIAAVVGATSVLAQTATPREPTFDVVSIKPTDPSTPGMSFGTRPDGGFVGTNLTVALLVSQAYSVSGRDIVGLPEWTQSARFDITATVPRSPTPWAPEQRRAMWQSMLAERFGFAAHTEKREVPAFDLVIARQDGRLGPNLTAANQVDCAARAAARQAALEAARAKGETLPPQPAFPTDGTLPPCSQRARANRFEGHMNLGSLAVVLRGMSGRPVVNKTRLDGYYNVRLDYSPADPLAPAAAGAAATELPSIFTALEEQLGLKLVPSRTSVDVLVVDRISRPTAN